MSNNLIFHYQPVRHSNTKNGIYLHESFSNRLGDLYSVNPVPYEPFGDTKEEVEEILRAMEADSIKYKVVSLASVHKQMELWVDEIELPTETVLPHYDDEETLEEDYYNTEGEVLDIVEYFNRRK